MRIVFAGTPEFAATALRALLEASAAHGFEIPLVLSQPDRPGGRGMKVSPTPVKAMAIDHGIAVATPLTFSRKRDSVEADAAHAALAAARADVLVVAAYGLILPPSVLDAPAGLGDAGRGRLTAINIHASLLPRWRGAAPAARAIEAGDTATGVTIMQMEAGLDTGPMLLTQSLEIAPSDTTATLTQRLAELGAQLIVAALDAATDGALRAVAQPADGVTYAHKLDKREALLDWNEPAELLARRVRAFDPFPVAAAVLGDLNLRIWRARAVASSGATPGTLVSADRDGVRIACADGGLLVTELQRAGGKRLAAADFIAGVRLPIGARFALPSRA